jgi:hypothetical protein
MVGAPNWELWGWGAPQIQRAYDGLEPPSQRRGSLLKRYPIEGPGLGSAACQVGSHFAF